MPWASSRGAPAGRRRGQGVGHGLCSKGEVQTVYLRQSGNKPEENPVLNRVVQVSVLTNRDEGWEASRQSGMGGLAQQG